MFAKIGHAAQLLMFLFERDDCLKQSLLAFQVEDEAALEEYCQDLVSGSPARRRICRDGLGESMWKANGKEFGPGDPVRGSVPTARFTERNIQHRLHLA